jgi:hypothetical protein
LLSRNLSTATPPGEAFDPCKNGSRVQDQQPEVPVESLESKKAAPEENELPESLPGFDLAVV